MADLFLDSKEIKDMTNRSTCPAQVRVLKAIGIEHKIRPDNTIAVLRAHVTKVFDGDSPTEKGSKVSGPIWDAI